jgi:hypothetical protein
MIAARLPQNLLRVTMVPTRSEIAANRRGPRWGRWRRRLAIAAGLLASGMLAGTAIWWLPRGTQHFLAARLRQELAAGPDFRAVASLRAALDLGPPGQRLVVESLGSTRRSVADAAAGLLLERISGWELGSPAQGRIRSAALARDLAQACPGFDAVGRARAASLARRLLLGPPPEAGSDRLVNDCELVLRSTMSGIPAAEVGPPPLPRSLGPGDAGDPRPVEPSEQLAPERASVASGSPLPGGGLEVEPHRPELPRYPRGRVRPASALGGAPRWGASNAPAPTSSADRTIGREAFAAPPAESPDARTNLTSRPQSAAPAEPPRGAAHPTVELMRRLHDGGAGAQDAQRELASRGFGPLEIELARRLTDDDPEVRRRLAEWLPRLPGIDARPWLLWLSEDSSPQVRLLAATLMSTTTDPALLERVAEMYRADPDADVRRQAGRRQASVAQPPPRPVSPP